MVRDALREMLLAWAQTGAKTPVTAPAGADSNSPSCREAPRLERRLREQGCQPVREGANHSVWRDAAGERLGPVRATARSAPGWYARSASSSTSRDPSASR
jgi:hypothetical protein